MSEMTEDELLALDALTNFSHYDQGGAPGGRGWKAGGASKPGEQPKSDDGIIATANVQKIVDKEKAVKQREARKRKKAENRAKAKAAKMEKELMVKVEMDKDGEPCLAVAEIKKELVVDPNVDPEMSVLDYLLGIKVEPMETDSQN